MFSNSPYMQGYVNPYEQRLNSMQPTMQSQQIVQVSGQGGANAYQLAPNSSVLLLDSTQPIVWLKQTDGAGFPTLTPYSIAPYQEAPQIDVKNLNDRLTALENRMGGIDNAEPNIKQTKSSSASTK